jgi:hypothetical protein
MSKSNRLAPRVTAWVDYKKQRAEITATADVNDRYGTAYDLSSIFPANLLAGMLLRQPGLRSGTTRWKPDSSPTQSCLFIGHHPNRAGSNECG